MNRRNGCDLCHIEEDHSGHKMSLLHRFNFALFEWNKYRRAIVKNRNGAEVHVKPYNVVTNSNDLNYIVNVNKGRHETKLLEQRANLEMHQNNGITYMFTVKNIQREKTIFLLTTTLLHPYPSFRLYDIEGQMGENVVLQLEPGATYDFKVTFRPQHVTVGTYSMPIAITLQTEKNKNFTISREMLINIVGNWEFNHVEEEAIKSPFTNFIWKDSEISLLHGPTTPIPLMNDYPIPIAYLKVIKMGLREFQGISIEDMANVNRLRSLMTPGHVTRNNYQDFFHVVLWIDEIGAHIMLQRYNMENVKMKVISNGKLAELDVPGLAEKRPSLINGDYVKMKLHGDHIAYTGIIKTVNNSNIWIQGIHKELLDYIHDDPGTELDVAFQLGRLPYERMHSGVNEVFNNNMVDYLFPEAGVQDLNIPAVPRLPDIEFINTSVRSNAEQRAAVEHILFSKHNIGPYIVFGPPGTGKTITIVEAILQLIRKNPKMVILVCAPANAACDMLTSKLIQSRRLSRSELIRVHSDTRDWSTVPNDVKEYSNYIEGVFTKPRGHELMKYRVIVTTLILSGKYHSKGLHPDYLFIDEAAQAMEPEAAVAIGLLSSGKRVVLAGDPRQLGPICASVVAEEYNLNISLLERLTNLPLYRSGNSNFIATLRLNFRAHPEVLYIPNNLFYNNQLQAVSRQALLDPIATICIYNKISRRKIQQNSPVEFCAIFAKERREGRSPSYFNPKEVEMVAKYVDALLNLTETRVVETDIGIVTPYIRQVYRIKDVLAKRGHPEVEVGTTETFQGREKRIIILSSVRAQHDLLLFDRKYKLGFISNKKRLNVALTRAMSKLIVIGCPNVLQFDNNWLQLIEFCEGKRTYFGAKRDVRNDILKNDVIQRLDRIHLRDVPYSLE